MGTLDDIFASMDFPAKLNNEMLVIDDVTREISIPQSERIFGVENDEKAERKYFQAPRYVGDNIDLSKLTLRAVWRNAQGDESYDLADDLKIEGDNVTFSWLLRKKFTAYKGTVAFIICATKVQEDGTITNEWNTTLAYGEVLEGLEAYDPVIGENEKDIIAQLIKKVTDTSAKAVQDVTAEGKKQIEIIESKSEEIKANRRGIEKIAIKNIVKGNPLTIKDSIDFPPVKLEILGSTVHEKIPSLEKPDEMKNSIFTFLGIKPEFGNNIKYLNYYMNKDASVISDSSYDVYEIQLSKSAKNLTVLTGGESRAAAICFYDDKNHFISGEAYQLRSKFQVAKPKNTEYCLISVHKQKKSSYDVIYDSLSMAPTIELSAVDRIYKDTDDDLWKKENNTLIKTFNGTEEWIMQDVYENIDRFMIRVSNIGNTLTTRTEQDCFCNLVPKDTTGGGTKANTCFGYGGFFYVVLEKGKYTLESFKNFLSKTNLKIIAKVETPEHETLSPTIQGLLNKVETHYPNCILNSNKGITLNLTYIEDTKTIVDGQQKQIDELRTLIEKYHPTEV